MKMRFVSISKFMGRKLINLTDKTFGEWRVLGASPRSDGQTYWICRCSCGYQKPVSGTSLSNGASKSCGKGFCRCRHGHSFTNNRTRTYRIWQNIIGRCCRISHGSFKHYGGRGIIISEQWKFFDNFLYDMGECPEGKSIDRINNMEGYSKENCRWATRIEQARNTRRNKFIEYNGERHSIPEWAELLNIPYDTLQSRLKRGCSLERCFSPLKLQRQKINDSFEA